MTTTHNISPKIRESFLHNTYSSYILRLITLHYCRIIAIHYINFYINFINKKITNKAMNKLVLI